MLVSWSANPSPNTHREHRLQGPHECALPSHLDRLLPPHPLQHQPRRCYLLRPIHRRFPNSLAPLGTMLVNLPIGEPKPCLLRPWTTPIVERGALGFSSCRP